MEGKRESLTVYSERVEKIAWAQQKGRCPYESTESSFSTIPNLFRKIKKRKVGKFGIGGYSSAPTWGSFPLGGKRGMILKEGDPWEKGGSKGRFLGFELKGVLTRCKGQCDAGPAAWGWTTKKSEKRENGGFGKKYLDGNTLIQERVRGGSCRANYPIEEKGGCFDEKQQRKELGKENFERSRRITIFLRAEENCHL